MNKKRIAVVGYGGMGSWHAKKLLISDVAEVAGIWDIDEARREAAKEKGIFVYSSFEDLLADKTVDIVTIATPNEWHMPLAVAAMEAGKNVISEKPVTLSSEDLQKMIDASNRTGKLFTVHQNRRWDADYLAIKELYASGEMGEIFQIESRVQGSHGIPGDWRGQKEHGGGMILDWGVHLIDQILQMVTDKKVERVYCRCDHITNYEVDDGFKLDLYFEKELTARIEVGTSHFINLPRWYVNATNGSAVIEDWNKPVRVVECTEWDPGNVVPVVTAAGLTKTMAPRDSSTIAEHSVELPKSDVHNFYRNVCAALDGKETQLIKHHELMRVMKIMEAAFLSDETGLPVAIDDKLC